MSKLEYDMKEYDDILRGEKPFSIKHHYEEFMNYYTAEGATQKIFVENGCGYYLSNGNFCIPHKWAHASLEEILKRGQEIADEKKYSPDIDVDKAISDVEWKIHTDYTYEFGQKKKMYIHDFKINGKHIKYVERNITDFGITINPDFEVEKGVPAGGLVMKNKDDHNKLWFNCFIDNTWKFIRPLTEEERICYLIVKERGKFSMYRTPDV